MSGRLGVLVVGVLIGSAVTSLSALFPLLHSFMVDNTVLMTVPPNMDCPRLEPVVCPKQVEEIAPRLNETVTKELAKVPNNTSKMTDVPDSKVEQQPKPQPNPQPKAAGGELSLLQSISNKNNNNRTGFCKRLPPGVTAATLWKSQASRILQTSRHQLGDLKDLPKSYPTWLEGLFDLMHTRFLRLGYRHAPLPSALREVLDIVETKLKNTNPNAKPLHVVVVGGSVTYGRGSCVDPFKQNSKVKTKNIQCNWPKRLQSMMNEFLGPGIVRVTNLAVGGTSTSLSTTVVKYKLYPDDARFLRKHGPDVIINAYSTNDALPFGANHTYDANYHREQREAAQHFIRAALDSRPCSQLPMVVYADDYVGNQHNLILAEQSNQRLTQEMAEWYGSMYISYATAVRRLVYANQQETILSPYWPWWSTNSLKPRIQVHFQMSTHMAMLWVVSYSILTAVVDYCDDDYSDAASSKLFPDMFPQVIMDMVERVPPPLLNATTTLQQISTDWLAASKTETVLKAGVCGKQETTSDEDAVNPCAIAFICGPMGTIRSKGVMNIFLDRMSTRTKGWSVEDDSESGGWSNKLGYVGQGLNATTTFVKDETETIVQTLKVFYLRSYGPKWANSKARFTLRGIDTKKKSTVYEKSFTLLGYHNSNTSIAYPYEIDLGKNALPKGIRAELTVTIVGGKTFKLIGMVMCNRH